VTKRTRLGLVFGLVVVVVTVSAVALQIRQVHTSGWEWRLTSSAAPPKITFSARDYHRGDESSVPADHMERGATPGGGAIYTQRTGHEPFTVIYVRDGREVWIYALMGGP
jgi:hypothetical protein